MGKKVEPTVMASQMEKKIQNETEFRVIAIFQGHVSERGNMSSRIH